MEKEKAIIFYSWLSDLDSKTNHYFILDTLKKAVKTLGKDDDLEVEPVIDRDTQGVAGSPDITKTIFDKIDQAHIFVCDVSIINKNALEHNPQTRLTPNPNVLIELGYALRKMGHERIIMVMNTAYGDPELLPFDLRSRRTARYSLTGDDNRQSERKRLEETLVESLRLSLGTLNTLTAQDIYNAKQATSAIREIYQILIKVDRLCDDLLYDINNAKRLSPDDAIRKIRTIKSTADRIKELIPLDLPALKPDLKNYSSALEKYWNRVVASRYGDKGEIMQTEELRKKAIEAKKEYKLNFEILKDNLEELMGNSTSPVS